MGEKEPDRTDAPEKSDSAVSADTASEADSTQSADTAEQTESVQKPDSATEAESVHSHVPSEGGLIKDRFSSDEVFQRIVAAADEELTASWRELFFSGVAGGLAISITFLMYASMTDATDGDPILSVLLYPLGFIYIILGGYQLYTENTLPPVALTLERLSSFTALFRHWSIVLLGNFAGGLVGALVLAWGGVFPQETALVAQDISQVRVYPEVSTAGTA